MRRADRLFQLIQMLRSARRPITAQRIAEALEVSPRTVYRDIADLMAHRVPIRGEAGVGYVLDEGYDLPPLMLTTAEVEAAVLGARWVIHQGDPALTRGAHTLLGKLQEVIPETLRPILLDQTMMVPGPAEPPTDAIDVAKVREWIRQQKQITIRYRDSKNNVSQRTLWPIAVAYFGAARLLVGWCELRNDFRHFRTDRILSAEFLEQRFPIPVHRLQEDWMAKEASK